MLVYSDWAVGRPCKEVERALKIMKPRGFGAYEQALTLPGDPDNGGCKEYDMGLAEGSLDKKKSLLLPLDWDKEVLNRIQDYAMKLGFEHILPIHGTIGDIDLVQWGVENGVKINLDFADIDTCSQPTEKYLSWLPNLKKASQVSSRRILSFVLACRNPTGASWLQEQWEKLGSKCSIGDEDIDGGPFGFKEFLTSEEFVLRREMHVPTPILKKAYITRELVRLNLGYDHAPLRLYCDGKNGWMMVIDYEGIQAKNLAADVRISRLKDFTVDHRHYHNKKAASELAEMLGYYIPTERGYVVQKR